MSSVNSAVTTMNSKESKKNEMNQVEGALFKQYNLLNFLVKKLMLSIKKEDLPRVKTELDALMLLSHQNICRMYQCIDTPLKFFIVMEVCCCIFYL